MAESTEEVDYSTLPLTEKLNHKVWKARLLGYEELAKQFRMLDPEKESDFKKYMDHLKKIATDSNIVAQEAGLVTLAAWAANAPQAPKTRAVLVPLVIEKSLAQMRAGTKAKALEVLLMFIEIDVADPVIEDMLPFLEHKTPKLVAGCIAALKDIVRIYGTKTVNIKPLLKRIPVMFAHSDKKVREEATQLVIEMYKWLGPAIESYLSDLKPLQKKELTEAFQTLPPGKPTPERLLRSQQAVASQAADDPMEIDGAEEEQIEEVDAFDLSEPVDLLAKMPKNFYTDLASSKWKERKEALEGLLAIAKTPRLADGNYGELIMALGKRVADANILVVTLALNLIECIAIGLRGGFQKYKSMVVSPILERCKEKKQSVVDALRSSLDAVFLTLDSLSGIIDEVTTAMNHKNPNVKAESVRWLVRCLKITKSLPPKGEVKTLNEMLLKSTDDSIVDVRESAFEGLGTLMKVVGERVMLPYLEKLDKIKEGRVREFYEKAEVKISPAGRKPPPSSSAASTAPKSVSSKPLKKQPAKSSNSDVKDKENSPPAPPVTSTSRPSSSSLAKKNKPVSSSSSLASARKPKAAAGGDVDRIQFKFSDEEAEAKLTQLMGISEEVLKEVGDGAWKVRLAAMESLTEALEKLDPKNVEAEVVIRVLTQKPGWKESNFQVMSKSLNIIAMMAKMPSFSRGCASLVIPALFEKIGDIKLRKPAAETLVLVAEMTSLNFVLSQAYDPLNAQKSPKVLTEGLGWINTSVNEFGIGGVSVRDLINMVKTVALASSNALVRNAGVKLLGSLRVFVGADISALLQDVTPSQMTTIEAEFSKVASAQPPEITRRSAADADRASTTDSMEDLIPRVDLSALINAKTIEDMGHSDWKIRKEALEEVVHLVEANKRVKPNLGDLLPALKSRVADSNKNLVLMAMDLCGNLATAMGKPFEKVNARVLIPVVTNCLTDNKVQMRTAAISSLDRMMSECSLESFMSIFGSSLMADSPALRKDLLKWLSERIAAMLEEGGNQTVLDVSPLIPAILLCLQHRDPDVRKWGTVVFGQAVKLLGYEAVKEKCSDLKGASAKTVMPILDGFKPTGRILSGSSSGPISSPSLKSTTSEQKRASASSSTLSKSSVSARASLKRKSVSVPQVSTSSASSKTEAVDGGDKKAPITTTDLKAKDARAAHDKGMTKWSFEVPRKELVEDLSQQMEPHFSREVHMLLFSTDHYRDKDNLAGLTLLDAAISSPSEYGLASEEMRARCVANSDTLLKYLTLRFFDTNTSMLIKCLDLLERLVGVLDEEGYHLSEYEASSFLPFFINKVGDNKETMRTRIRGILKQLCRIYPASKMFGYIMDHGLKSKNGRTRTECLEELGALIQRNGLTVCNQPNKSLSTIAHQISDRDNSVRSAAINTLLQVYILVGDKVFGYIGRLTEKDKSLLEERFKRVKPVVGGPVATKGRIPGSVSAAGNDVDESVPLPSKLAASKKASAGETPSRESPIQNTAMEQEPAAKSSNDSSSSPPVKKEFSLDLEKLELPTLSNTAHSDIPSRSMAAPMHSAPTPQIPKQRSSIALENREYVMDYVVSQITSGDAYQSIDALKQLETQLGGPPEAVIPHIDQIVNAITLQVRLAFTAPDSSSPAVVRLCKHLVNALVQVFVNKSYSLEVSTDALHPLLQELLHRLLDQNLTSSESGQQLARALNILMVRILDNAHRNASFSVLLSILDKTSAGLRVPEATAGPNAKFTELVMKCLWKLTKTLGKSLKTESISPEQLLMDVNHFLVSTPPAEWKRRAAEKLPLGDMPLRTAKTILHELVQALGEDVFGHLGFIPEAEKSYVYSYLRHMMDGSKKQASNGQGSTTSSLKSSKSEDAIAEESVARSAPELKSASRSSSMDQLEKPSPTEEFPALDTSDVEAVNQRLSEIFGKIGSKEHTKQGIYELHEFQVRYPESQSMVDVHFSKTGSYFQSYIRRGLANIASGDGMDGVSSSSPSTPRQSTSPSATRGDGEKLETGKEISSGVYVQRLKKIQQMVEQTLNNEKSRSTPELNEASNMNEEGTPAGGGRGGLVRSASSLSSIAPMTSSSQIPDVSVNLRPVMSARREPDAGDKAQTVAGLKERLERMKNSMRGNAG